MKKLALLSTAFVLALAFEANAATVTVFDDHFTDDSFIPMDADTNPGGLVHWTGSFIGRSDCGVTGGPLTCIDMSAEDSAPDKIISEDFSILAGAVYNMTVIFMAASGEAFSQAFVISADEGYVHFGDTQTLPDSGGTFVWSNTFGIDSTAKIQISMAAPTSGGSGSALLDRVTLTMTTPDDPPTVPVPASAPLMLAGLGAFGLLRRRKARA